MRIGVDVRATQMESGVRGIGNYIYTLVDGLTRLDPAQEYVLFAFPDRPLPPQFQSLPDCCRVVTLPTRLLPPYHWGQPVRYVWRLKYLQAQREHGAALARAAARERLDVLHQPAGVEWQYFVNSRPSCRLVKTFFDAIPSVFPGQFLERWPVSRRYVYQLQMAGCRGADAVVAISESARRDAIQYARVPASKLHVVYPVVSDDFQPVTDAARLGDCFARLGVRPPYFLFCSAPEPTKNITRVLEAYAAFVREWPGPSQLVMVSRRNGEVEQDVQRLGLPPEQVLFTGYVSELDLVTLYAGATALVSPSLYEGFGLPAGQAMRAGTPVIASDRSSQPEVVGDAGLLVDPEDVGAIAGAMRRLAGDPALRAALSARGRERAARFDWRHQAQAMLDIYRLKPT